MSWGKDVFPMSFLYPLHFYFKTYFFIFFPVTPSWTPAGWLCTPWSVSSCITFHTKWLWRGEKLKWTRRFIYGYEFFFYNCDIATEAFFRYFDILSVGIENKNIVVVRDIYNTQFKFGAPSFIKHSLFKRSIQCPFAPFGSAH